MPDLMDWYDIKIHIYHYATTRLQLLGDTRCSQLLLCMQCIFSYWLIRNPARVFDVAAVSATKSHRIQCLASLTSRLLTPPRGCLKGYLNDAVRFFTPPLRPDLAT